MNELRAFEEKNQSRFYLHLRPFGTETKVEIHELNCAVSSVPCFNFEPFQICLTDAEFMEKNYYWRKLRNFLENIFVLIFTCYKIPTQYKLVQLFSLKLQYLTSGGSRISRTGASTYCFGQFFRKTA